MMWVSLSLALLNVNVLFDEAQVLPLHTMMDCGVFIATSVISAPPVAFRH